MKINNIKINNDKFDINLNFYNFLKKITQSKLSDNQINDLLLLYYSNTKLNAEKIQEIYYVHIEKNLKKNKKSLINDIVSEINDSNIELFVFSLKLNLIKKLLLEEAKITQYLKSQELEGLNQLSLAYDKLSTQVAYATRISGALLSLLFFEKLAKGENNFLADSTVKFLESLMVTYQLLTGKGLESNQIFMLLFSETINQSITSSAGASYEDRIKNVLIAIGVPIESITKTHDKIDSSTEFDFFFKIKGRSYGISAKRTLRERYKQFIKTAYMAKLDIMIEITLGTDLRPNIADAISNHGVHLFVADEVYNSNNFLHNLKNVYPVSQLTLKTLEKLKNLH